MALDKTLRSSPMIAALVCALLIGAQACRAQTQDPLKPETPTQPELVIGTKEAPPFAMKAADGTWQGISIDLWRRIADELHLRYRFAEEASVPDLIAGVATGKFDIVAAAMTGDGRARPNPRFYAAVLRNRARHCDTYRRGAKLAAYRPNDNVVWFCPGDHGLGRSGAGRGISRLALRAAPQ
jgi:hypothetical protein